GGTVAEALFDVERHFPRVRDYLVDERGSLRKHVNIFIGDALVRDRAALSDPLAEDAEISVFQALSGG
ncbi:MAG TPA: MoaD/ThiS family protein, partial [Pirellulales bacterium]